MLCPECSKLAILATKKICVRCQGSILNNLSCICDKCSNEERVCSICLKKTIPAGTNKTNRYVFGGGCRSCGR